MWDGTAMVDLHKPTDPQVLGFLETTGGVEEGLDGVQNAWRDIKVVGNVAYIVAEVSFHGMQTFDLTRLRPGVGATSLLATNKTKTVAYP